ncbi:hypothetical protein HA466_0286850 [Hirschfeldia incana]|nr:hypothetical protein HA466_0286850 [Hirschfeldia incana]
MDSVFRSVKEKLEKEHRESKKSGKLKLEREKKDKDAAERQRQAVEASQRARRVEAIEAQMMKEDVIPRKGGDYIIPAIPPWISKKMQRNEDHDEVSKWDDEEGAEWEVGEAPGTGKFTWNNEAEEAEEAEKDERRRQRLLRKRRRKANRWINY